MPCLLYKDKQHILIQYIWSEKGEHQELLRAKLELAKQLLLLLFNFLEG